MNRRTTNKTASFLCGEDKWRYSRVELVDVDGREGGVRIRVDGTGAGTIEPVRWRSNPNDNCTGLYTTAFPFTLPEADINNLFNLLVRLDFLAIVVPNDHRPSRGETSPMITLFNHLGKSCIVQKYASQKVERFDSVFGALTKLEKKFVPLRDDSRWEEEGWRPWSGF